MKIGLKKIWMTSIIFIISLCSCFFFNRVFAAKYLGDKITKEQLEGEFSSKTLDRLQVCADYSDTQDLYFNFNTEKFLNQARKKGTVEIMAGVHERYYHYWSNSVCCISPEDHLMAHRQQPTCVIDVPGDGTVTVYKIKNGTVKHKTTTYKQNKAAVQRAYEMAYYAAKSVENDEGPRN